MDAEIDPAETGQRNETGQQEHDQIGSGFVFQIPSAEEEEHPVKNQNGKGVSTGKGIAALMDQMERKVRPGTMKGNL